MKKILIVFFLFFLTSNCDSSDNKQELNGKWQLSSINDIFANFGSIIHFQTGNTGEVLDQTCKFKYDFTGKSIQIERKTGKCVSPIINGELFKFVWIEKDNLFKITDKSNKMAVIYKKIGEN